MSKKRMTREQRKDQILLAFDLWKSQGITASTMYDVAKRLRLSASAHLMNYLNELVDEGELQSHKDDYRPGVMRSWFYLPGTVKREKLFHVNAPGDDASSKAQGF